MTANNDDGEYSRNVSDRPGSISSDDVDVNVVEYNRDRLTSSKRGDSLDDPDDSPAPFIFRPRIVTLMFSVVSLVNYFDRGLFASVLKPISSADNFDLDKTMAGLINSMFIVGFMVFSPIFAHMAHRFDPMHLTGLGLLIWVGSAVTAGLAHNFWIFLAARTVCGIGEASFVSLVPPFIEDYAPPHEKTKWLSLFYLSIPVGAALGYVVGGPSSKRSVDGWRWPFIGEGAAMFPLALYVFLVPRYIKGEKLGVRGAVGDVPGASSSGAKGSSSHAAGLGTSINASNGVHDSFAPLTAPVDEVVAGDAVVEIDTSIIPSLKRLAVNPVYILAVIGYSCYQFVVGGISTWGVTYLEDPPHKVDPDEASIAFGACAAAGGLVGTILGGYITDHFGGSTGLRGIQRSMKVCTLFTLASIPFFELGFIVADVHLLYVLVFVGQCLLWTSSAPLNSAIMTSVDSKDRGLAMAISVFSMHALGDFPSSVGIGAIEQKIDNWTITMVLVVGYLIFAVFSWGLSWFMAWRNATAQERISGSAQVPLLAGDL